MKTSNIILLAIFASILIWVLAVFMTAKAKMHELTDNLPEKEKNEVIKKITNRTSWNVIGLDEFDAIHVIGNGSVIIYKSDKNELSEKLKNDCSVEVKDRILYLNLKKGKYAVSLGVIKINKLLFGEKTNSTISYLGSDTLTVLAKDKAKVRLVGIMLNLINLEAKNNSDVSLENVKAINVSGLLKGEKIKTYVSDFKCDTIKAIVKDKAKVSFTEIKSNYIKLRSEDNSDVKFVDVNQKQNEAYLEIKDNSIVTINNTKGMSISVKKDANATYKDY